MVLRPSRPTPNLRDPQDLLKKLRTALKADGDFPVRARVVSELYSLANNENTNVNKIVELILKEPSLGTRVISLVNSAFYHRGRTVLTVSQAVTQLGMRTICDICAGFVLIHKFVPAAKRGGIFAENIKRSIVGALLTSGFAGFRPEPGIAEKGYLAGTFYNLGHLLLAYYFPQVFEAAAKRAQARGQEVKQSIRELLGIGPGELNLTIVEALEIPKYYKDLLIAVSRPKSTPVEDPSMEYLIRALGTGCGIADELIMEIGLEGLVRLIDQFERTSGFTRDQLERIIGALPDLFKQHCAMIELGFLKLPDYVEQFSQEQKAKAAAEEETA